MATDGNSGAGRSGSGGDTTGGLWLVTAALAALALIVATAAIFLPRGGSAPSSGGGSVVAAAKAGPKTEDVTLSDLAVTPKAIAVPVGTDLTLRVKNAGQMSHDLKVDGTTGTELLKPGATGLLHVGPVSGDLTLWCTVAGHKAAGMSMTITAQGGTQGAAPAATMAMSHDSSASSASAATSGDAAIDFNATPGADWQPYDPTLKPAPGGTEHKISLDAIEVVREVAPGVKQQLWTFNGTMPGPALRGKVGDLFTVTLTNKGKVAHSIDFHASKVAWNVKMRSIQPGESLVYQYTAKYAGIFMYHCGTAPALHHIGNGMFGAVIIDPPVLAPVDHEYVIVQSEVYTGPQGEPGDLTKMVAENWDAVVFNGYVNQYKFHPIAVKTGERIRVWVLDAGPSENSAFHIVGTVFDTVFKEGTYLLRPDARKGGSQVLDLQPAQGGFVEFSFDEDGLYPMVTHKFANVGKGALGLFASGDVSGMAAGGH